MEYLIIQSLIIFIAGLEVALFLSIFISFLPIQGFRNIMDMILEPILRPIRIMLKHSVFQSGVSDSSPIIAFIVLSYILQLLEQV